MTKRWLALVLVLLLALPTFGATAFANELEAKSPSGKLKLYFDPVYTNKACTVAVNDVVTIKLGTFYAAPELFGSDAEPNSGRYGSKRSLQPREAAELSTALNGQITGKYDVNTPLESFSLQLDGSGVLSARFTAPDAENAGVVAFADNVEAALALAGYALDASIENEGQIAALDFIEKLASVAIAAGPSPRPTIANKAFTLTGYATTNVIAQVTNTGEANTATNVTYRWVSSDTSKVTVSAGDDNAATITGVGIGSAKVTVYATQDDVTYSDTVTVTVAEKLPASPGTTIQIIDNEDYDLATAKAYITGSSIPLKALFGTTVEGIFTEDPAYTDTSVTWSTDAETDVATISEAGVLKCLKATTAAFTVTATSKKANTVKTTSGAITVTDITAGTVPAPQITVLNDTGAAVAETEANEYELATTGTATLSDVLGGAKIYYAMGYDTIPNQPSYNNGTLYTGALKFDKNGTYTIRAIAYDNNYANQGDVVTFKVNVHIPVESVTIAPASATINGKGELTLSATVAPANAAAQQITWAVEAVTGGSLDKLLKKQRTVGPTALNAITNEVEYISKDGKIITKGPAGVVTVTATADGVTAKCDVTIKDVPVTGMTLDQTSMNISKGQTYVLTANVTPANASDQNVVFSSNNDEYVDLYVDDETAPNTVKVTGLQQGTATINAQIGQFTRSCIVTVDESPAQQMAKPLFSKPNGTVFTKEGDTVTAYCPDTNYVLEYKENGLWVRSASASTPVTFTLASNVNNTFEVRAVDPHDARTTSEIATGNFKSEIAVTGVTIQTAAGVEVEEGEAITFNGGEVQTYNPIIEPYDTTNKASKAYNQQVTWKSSDEKVAKVTVDAKTGAGSVKGVGAGDAIITVTTLDGAYTAKFRAHVVDVIATSFTVTPVGVTISGTKYPLKIGEQFENSVKFWSDENGTGVEVFPLDKTVTWVTSAPAKASVTTAGVVSGLAIGDAQISATYKDCPFQTINVLVADASDTVAPVTFTGVYADESVADLTKTLDKAITLKLGTATTGAKIYYTLDGTKPTEASTQYTDEGISLTKTTTVYAMAVSGTKFPAYKSQKIAFSIGALSVTLDATKAELAKGATKQLTATVSPETATVKDIVWASSNTAVAKVDSTGIVTAVAAGTANITATVKGTAVKATCVVTVLDTAVTSVTVLPATLNMYTSDLAQQLTAVVLPAAVADKTVAWTSEDSRIARVSNGGVVTAVAAGTTKIKATAGSFSGYCEVTVEMDPLTIPDQPANRPIYVPSAKTFEGVANTPLTTVIGKLNPGIGQTLEQIRYYYDIRLETSLKNAALSIDKLGNVTLNVSDIGKTDTTFTYAIWLEWKESRGTVHGKIEGAGSYEEGNTIKVIIPPTTITYAPETIGDVAINNSETKTITAGKVTNAAEFAKVGIALSAKATVTAVEAPKADIINPVSANIDATGVVTVTMTKPAVGTFTVDVTVSATGYTDVKAGSFKLTVTKAPITEYSIMFPLGYLYETVSANNYKLAITKKQPVQLTLNEGVATNWKSSNKKVVTVSASGLLTFKKTGKAYITCTNPLGTESSMAIEVVKPSKELKLQFTLKPTAKNPKYVTIKAGSTITLPVNGSLAVRAVNKAPAGAKPMTITWLMADETIANVPNHATNKAQLMGVKEGTTTLTLSNAFGATLTFNVQVVTLADEAAKALEVEEGIRVKGGMKEAD